MLKKLLTTLIIGFLSLSLQAQSISLFEKYTWLTDIIDPSTCESGNIVEYDLGAFAYLLITTPEGTKLYFETGQIFCRNRTNFDCVAAYGFSEEMIGLTFGCMEMPDPIYAECAEEQTLIGSENKVNIKAFELINNLEDYLSSASVDSVSFCILNGAPPLTFDINSLTDDDLAFCYELEYQTQDTVIFYKIIDYKNDSIVNECSGSINIVDNTLLEKSCFLMASDTITYDTIEWAYFFNNLENLLLIYDSLKVELVADNGQVYSYDILSPFEPVILKYNLPAGPYSYRLLADEEICSGSVYYNDGIEALRPICITEKLQISSALDFDFIRYEDVIPNIRAVAFERSINNFEVTLSFGDEVITIKPRFFWNSRLSSGFPELDIKGDVSYSITILDELCTGTIEFVSGMISSDIFEEFPWVSNYVDQSNCGGSKIDVYQVGVHKYLNIESPSTSALYYQNGNKYCTNSPTNHCPSVYGFSDDQIIETVDCSTGFSYNGTLLTGEYTVDYVTQQDSCPFRLTETIDLRELETNCVIIDEIENCLSGLLTISSTGDYQFSTRTTPRGRGRGLSGGGSMEEIDGRLFDCKYGPCRDINLIIDGDRIEFETTIEDCILIMGWKRLEG